MKKFNEEKLQFYVLISNFGNKKVDMYNIFNNIVIYEDIVKMLKKNPSREELRKELDSVCMNQLWGRHEYEIEARQYASNDELIRVDAYQQVKANLDVLVDYLIGLIGGEANE